MTEPDVTLTDYALAVECLIFAVLLAGSQTVSRGLRFWCVFFFASVCAASLIGGTVHGFFVDESTRGYAILWPATMLAIGVTSLSAWIIGAHLMHFQHMARWVMIASAGQFAIYVFVVLFRSEEFLVAIVNNVPAVLFLLAVLARAIVYEPRDGLLPAAAGLTLNIAAGILQQFHVGIHPEYFNHNAVYHALQAIALLLFFTGCRRLMRPRADAATKGSGAPLPDADDSA